MSSLHSDYIAGSQNTTNDKDNCYQKVRDSGVQCFRIWANHKPMNGVNDPDKNMVESLCKIVNKNGHERYLDLAIGSRVSCTINLGTQIGTIT